MTHQDLPAFAGDGRAERILGQGLVAFGQGAAGVRISLDAVGFGRNIFGLVVNDVKDQWPKYRDSALAVITSIGEAAASGARGRGHEEITVEDLVDAIIDIIRDRRSIPCLKLKHYMEHYGLM